MSVARILKTAVLIVAIALIGVVLYLSFADLSKFRPKIEEAVTEATGRAFTINGTFDLDVLRPPTFEALAKALRARLGREVRVTSEIDPDLIGGVRIRAGDTIGLWYPSANRDERQFVDPYRFDVGRRPNYHVGYGHGPHFCLGANLARWELRAMFAELARRVTGLAVVTEPDVEPNIFARAVRRFDLTFTTR